MRTLHFIIFSCLLLGGLTSCMNQNVDPSNEKFAQNDADIKKYVETKGLSGTTTSSGLYYALTSANPTAEKATIGEEVEFTYKSYNLQDVFIDSTIAGKPVYYPLGIQTILAGLEEGLSLMREGEKATLLIPSYLAYGSNAPNANLPAYSVVRFDVQLVKSRDENQQIQQYVAAKKITVTDSSSTGLRISKTVSNTAGAQVTSGQTVTIKYIGRTLRASMPFDSTGSGTFDAVLGQSRYVKGFEEGLLKMRVGESATIIFPSTSGYGKEGRLSGNQYIIPPNAPLRFDLQVISAK